MKTLKIEGKSNANRKRKTHWCLLSLQSCDGLFLLARMPIRHKDTIAISRVFANVSANVIALNRCSVEIYWNKNEVWRSSSLMSARRQLSSYYYCYYYYYYYYYYYFYKYYYYYYYCYTYILLFFAL